MVRALFSLFFTFMLKNVHRDFTTVVKFQFQLVEDILIISNLRQRHCSVLITVIQDGFFADDAQLVAVSLVEA